jgi:hypothetical protein
VFPYPEAGYYSMLSQGSSDSGTDSDKSHDYLGTLKAIEFMQNDPPEPFCIFLTPRGAHPPYGAPKEWNDKWKQDVLAGKGHPLRPPFNPGKPRYHSKDNGIPHYRNLTMNETGCLIRR